MRVYLFVLTFVALNLLGDISSAKEDKARVKCAEPRLLCIPDCATTSSFSEFIKEMKSRGITVDVLEIPEKENYSSILRQINSKLASGIDKVWIVGEGLAAPLAARCALDAKGIYGVVATNPTNRRRLRSAKGCPSLFQLDWNKTRKAATSKNVRLVLFVSEFDQMTDVRQNLQLEYQLSKEPTVQVLRGERSHYIFQQDAPKPSVLDDLARLLHSND